MHVEDRLRVICAVFLFVASCAPATEEHDYSHVSTYDDGPTPAILVDAGLSPPRRGADEGSCVRGDVDATTGSSPTVDVANDGSAGAVSDAASGSVGRAEAGADVHPFAGTWQGKLLGTGNEERFMRLQFSPSGYLLTYDPTNPPSNYTELKSAGQVVRYVPEGGGVQTTELLTITAGPESTQMVIRESFEQASFGTISQSYSSTGYIFTLTPEGLQTRAVVIKSNSYGDSTVSGTARDNVSFGGVLRRL